MITIKEVARGGRRFGGHRLAGAAGQPGGPGRDAPPGAGGGQAAAVPAQRPGSGHGDPPHPHRGSTISDIANPFFIRAVRAIEDGAQENGYNVILCNTDENPAKETQYLRVPIEKRGGRDHSRHHGGQSPLRWGDVRWSRIPLVLFDRELPRLAIDTVKVDSVLGGRLATEHLLRLGHRRIAIIHGPVVRSTGGRAAPGVPGRAAGRRAAPRPRSDPGRRLQAGVRTRPGPAAPGPHAPALCAVLHQQPDDRRGVADPGRAGGPDAGGLVPDRL